MYRIAVCDDEQADAAYVVNLIKKWASDHAVMVHVETFPSAEAFWFRYEEDRTFDILFLDIEMGAAGSGVPEAMTGMAGVNVSQHMTGMAGSDVSHQMNGIELAVRIRERKYGCALQIVFVTGYMDYIEKGYDVEALHYLLKPVTQERLFSVLGRAVQRVEDRERELCLQMPDGMVRIPSSEVRYLEVQRNYVTVHGDEDYTVKKTLGDLERNLDGSFFRTGRSFIVNLRFVKKITKSQVLLKDGTQVPLSRGLYEEINRAMIRYF